MTGLRFSPEPMGDASRGMAGYCEERRWSGPQSAGIAPAGQLKAGGSWIETSSQIRQRSTQPGQSRKRRGDETAPIDLPPAKRAHSGCTDLDNSELEAEHAQQAAAEVSMDSTFPANDWW
jgi:hypothetical protein